MRELRRIRPLWLCAPVSKNGSDVLDPREHLVCFELTAEALCVPSLKK